MGKLNDLTGQVFDRLTVLQKVPAPPTKPGRRQRTEAFWECGCSCGNSKVVAGPNLRSGNTRSCGCAHKEQLAERNRILLTLDPWESDMRLYIRRLGYRKLRAKLGSNQFQVLAKTAQQEVPPGNAESWALTLSSYKRLVLGVCYYCGRAPAQPVHGAASALLLKNGIDRVDNTKGYEESNCVSCCKSCNKEKRAQSLTVFVENTRRRYQWLKSKGLITS